MVLDAVARLESRWEAELVGVEFAVQEVPEADELVDDSVPLPLARTVPGTPNSEDPARPATPARIVVYRRPLMARSETDGELATWSSMSSSKSSPPSSAWTLTR